MPGKYILLLILALKICMTSPIDSQNKLLNGDLSTDWYETFKKWDAELGDKYLDGKDGGSLAWGPSGYTQRAYLELYLAFNDVRWLDKLAQHIDRIMKIRSDTPPYKKYDPQYIDGFKGWGQNRYTQYKDNYTEWFSDDGLIISPIVAFTEIVWNNKTLHPAYKAKADEYLYIVEQDVIAKWYKNWDPDNGWSKKDNSRIGENAGYHLYEWAGWKNQPLNMYLSFTDALVTLHRLSTLPGYSPYNPKFPAFYKQQSEQMLGFFHSQLQLDPEQNLYVWKYGPNSHWPDLIEDVGHSFIDIQAALQGVHAHLHFAEKDLERMASTFIHNIWNGSLENPSFRYYVDGKQHKLDDARGHWGFGFLHLAKYDYQIWQAMAAYYEKNVDISTTEPYIAVTAAFLAVAAQNHDRWPPGSPQRLSANRVGNDVRLEWTPPSTDAEDTPLTGLAGYRVYRSESPEGPFFRFNGNTVKTPYFIDSGAGNQPYHYRVTAVDWRRPANESPASMQISVR